MGQCGFIRMCSAAVYAVLRGRKRRRAFSHAGENNGLRREMRQENFARLPDGQQEENERCGERHFCRVCGRKKFCPQPLQKIAVGAILQKLFEPP